MSEPMTASATRERMVRWQNPLRTATEAASMDGLSFLRAMAAGEIPIPPVAETLDFAGFDVEAGRVSFRIVPREFHYNPIGAVHGGVLATLADSAMGCAVHSTLTAGSGYTTLEFKINFVRPVTVETGEIVATGEVVHRGRRVATAEARITDADGRLLAHASTTCLVLEG